MMGWRVSSAMEEKLRFVYEYERDEQSMKDLCVVFGISRETGYVWLRRYRLYALRALRRRVRRTGRERCR